MAHLLIEKTVIPDRRLPLPGKVVVLGRSLDVDVPIPHLSVSRRHALVELSESGWRISDLGSVNGTWVNAERLEEGERVPIGIGMPFRLGDVVFRIAADEVLDGEPEARAAVVAAAPAPARITAPTADALRPIIVPELTAAPRVLASRPKEPAKTRARPSPLKRAKMRKQKQDAMRWMGLILTVVLVALAAVFAVKIIGKADAGSPADQAGGNEEKKPDPDRIETPKELESLFGDD